MIPQRLKTYVALILFFSLSAWGNDAEQELLKELSAVIEQAAVCNETFLETVKHAGELGRIPEDELQKALSQRQELVRKMFDLKSKYGDTDISAIPEGRKLLSESRYAALCCASELREEWKKLTERGIVKPLSVSDMSTWGLCKIEMQLPAKHEDSIQRVCESIEKMDAYCERIEFMLRDVNDEESAADKCADIERLYAELAKEKRLLQEYLADDAGWKSSRPVEIVARLRNRLKTELFPAEKRVRDAEYYGIMKYEDFMLIDNPDTIPIPL